MAVENTTRRVYLFYVNSMQVGSIIEEYTKERNTRYTSPLVDLVIPSPSRLLLD